MVGRSNAEHGERRSCRYLGSPSASDFRMETGRGVVGGRGYGIVDVGASDPGPLIDSLVGKSRIVPEIDIQIRGLDRIRKIVAGWNCDGKRRAGIRRIRGIVGSP